jgi:hypothetical protein
MTAVLHCCIFIVEPSGILCIPPVAIFFSYPYLDLDFIFSCCNMAAVGFPGAFIRSNIIQSPQAE